MCLTVGALFALARPSFAQTQLGTVEVEGERPGEMRPKDRRADSRSDDRATPLVTVISADNPSPRIASVSDLIEGQAGVTVRSRGGLGAFTSVSLRGSDAGEVEILIDGVPISRGASGLIDLSQIPIEGVDRVEIYRGAPPPEFGSEAVGGAINIITRKGGVRRSYRASVGTGSYGARSASLGIEQPFGSYRVSATAAYRGAKGNFTYLDNNGTLFDRTDDHYVERQNNDFDQGSADVTLRSNGRTRFSLGVHGFMKEQGVPGLGVSGLETLHARLQTERLFIEGAVERSLRRVDLRFGANLLFERILFSNPLGEQVGPYGPSTVENNSIVAGVTGRAQIPWGRHQLVTVLAEARAEHRAPSDLLHADHPALGSTRGIFGVAVADALRFVKDRIAIDPSLRLDVNASQLAADLQSGASTDWFLSPRVGFKGEATSFLTLRASAGRYVRFPTLLEQFGDGAFVLPTKQIQPESAWGGDVSAILHLSRTKFAATLEGVFFGRAVSDYITFVAVANALGAVNFGDARVWGSELRFTGRLFDFLRATIDYTFLDTENLSIEPGAHGKELPYRAPHQLTARLEAAWAPFRVFYQLDFVSDLFRDPQNYNAIPAHVLHGLGVSVEHGIFSFSVEVQNLADLRVVSLPLGGSARQNETVSYPLVDFFNYPLPGRALYAILALRI